MHLKVDKSQTLISLLCPAEKRNLSLGSRAKAVRPASVSTSMLAFIDALEESKILIASPFAQAMKEPSEETAKGPPL